MLRCFPDALLGIGGIQNDHHEQSLANIRTLRSSKGGRESSARRKILGHYVRLMGKPGRLAQALQMFYYQDRRDGGGKSYDVAEL
jgi:hypothetical protein